MVLAQIASGGAIQTMAQHLGPYRFNGGTIDVVSVAELLLDTIINNKTTSS